MAELMENRRLFREAADLAIRLQNDPTNPVSLQIVRAFVARSPAHAAAWARVAEIHGMAGQILARQDETPGKGRLTRRSLMIGAAVGIGAAGAGSLILPPAILRMRADYITATAEIRRIDLPDGSVMTLGPDSAAANGYSDVHRAIDLLAGMAFFEVADDSARPFIVSSGQVTAMARGTAFNLSSDAGFVSISVEDGIVEARGSETAAEEIGAGEWITFDSSDLRAVRGTRAVSEIAAWRGGMIFAEQETVAAMVARISRWVPGRIVVANPSLRSRVVSGVFDVRDPVRALEAVARPFGAKVRRIGSLLTVVSLA